MSRFLSTWTATSSPLTRWEKILRVILWWAKIIKLKQHPQNLAVSFILRECVSLQSFRVCPECVCLQAHIVCPSEGETREAYRVYSVTRSMLWQFDGDNEHEILFHGIYDDLSMMKYFNLIQNMPRGAILQNNKLKLLTSNSYKLQDRVLLLPPVRVNLTTSPGRLLLPWHGHHLLQEVLTTTRWALD